MGDAPLPQPEASSSGSHARGQPQAEVSIQCQKCVGIMKEAVTSDTLQGSTVPKGASCSVHGSGSCSGTRRCCFRA